MKAKIVKSEKQMIPQFSMSDGADHLTVCVVTTVDFLNDDGSPYHTQTYAQRPEEIDAENPSAYFDRIAEVLQSDLDGQHSTAQTQATSKLADQIIEKLMPTNPQDEVKTI